MITNVGYEASPWQLDFHRLIHDEALGAGAAGPGKTECLLMDPVPQIIVEHQRCEQKDHPFRMGWGDSTGVALHLRRTLKELEQSISRTHRIFPKMDPEAHFDTQRTTWTFASGYKFQFGHCKDRESYTDYLSSAFSHIAYDELITFEEEQYMQINTRLRSTDPVLSQMLRVRAMSNPMMTAGMVTSVRDPHWVRRRFVDPAPEGRMTLYYEVDLDDGRKHRSTRIYLPATLYDNPNKAFVKQYEARLAASPKHIREAMLYGNWYFTAGSFYGDVWERSKHVCAPFKVPPDWPMFRSMDWGYKQPGCIHWWAMDGDENLYAVKEVTFKGKDVEEVALLIQQVEREMGIWKSGPNNQGGYSTISGPADTQLWEDRGDIGLSKAAIMEKNGVQWVRAEKTAGGIGRRHRKTNADKLTFRLKDNRGGRPGVVFFKNCEMAIRTIPMIQTNLDLPDEPMDGGDDHWHDSVLYACAYASHGSAGIGQRRVKDEWDDDDEVRVRARRGRDGYGSRV